MEEKNQQRSDFDSKPSKDFEKSDEIKSLLEGMQISQFIEQRFSDKSKYFELENEVKLKEIVESYNNKLEEDKKWLSKLKRIVKIVTVIIGIIGFSGILAFVVWTKNQIAKVEKQVISQTDSLIVKANNHLEFIDSKINEQIDSVSTKVNKKIREKFRSDTINVLIEKYAKLFVEEESESYIHSVVNKTVEPFVTEVESLLAASKENLNYLSELAKVRIIAEKAKNGSKRSFIELADYVDDSSEIGKFATEKLKDIVTELLLYNDTPGGMRFGLAIEKNGESISVSKLSVKEIALLMEQPTTSHTNRHSMMADIYEKHQIKETYEVALDVLENSDSLPTCAAFCGILKKIYIGKAPKSILDFESWKSICKSELKKL